MPISTRRWLCLLLVAGPATVRAQPGLDSRYWQQPPGSFPLDPTHLPVLADEALQESQRFVDAAYSELASSYAGQQVIVRGQSMIQAAQSLVAQLDRHGPGGQDIRTEAARFDAAVGGARSALGQLGGFNAPATSRSLRRVERLAQDIRTLADGGGYYPPGPPPGAGGIDRTRLRATAQQAIGDANQAATTLYDSGWARSYPYDQVVRQLDSLSNSLATLTSLIDGQAPDGRIRSGLRPLQANADQIGRLVASAQATYPPPPSFGGSWNRTLAGINRMNSLAGGGPDPGPPPVIQPPANPGGAVGLIDQMTPELDQFVAVLRANINAIPDGFQFLRDAQGLQAQLVQLRQGLLNGRPPRRTERTLAEADQLQRRLRQRINQVAGGRGGPNIDRIRRVGALFDQLRPAIQG